MNRLPTRIRLISTYIPFVLPEENSLIRLKLLRNNKAGLKKFISLIPPGCLLFEEPNGGVQLTGAISSFELLVHEMAKYPEWNELRSEIKWAVDGGKQDKSLRWVFRHRYLDLREHTAIAGVLNVTPDSFSDGGDFLQPQQAVDHALQMVESGADVIDIGGESTRPGAASVSQQQEMDRVLPVIEELRRHHDIPISIDTYKSAVAEAALKAGADIINDISGARFDKKILTVARDYQAGLVLMHIKGTPQNMQKNPYYQDVMEEILVYLDGSIQAAVESGVPADHIVVDPGIGFGKRWFDNYDIINRLSELQILRLPVLVGVSRKSFLGLFSAKEAKNRSAESLAADIMAIRGRANILRVHDVEETKRAVKIVDIFRMRALGMEAEAIEEMFHA